MVCRIQWRRSRLSLFSFFFLHLHIITSPLEAVQQRNGRDKGENTSAAPSSSSSVRVLRLLLRNEVSLSSSRSKAPPASVSPEVEEEKKIVNRFSLGTSGRRTDRGGQGGSFLPCLLVRQGSRRGGVWTVDGSKKGGTLFDNLKYYFGGFRSVILNSIVIKIELKMGERGFFSRIPDSNAAKQWQNQPPQHAHRTQAQQRLAKKCSTLLFLFLASTSCLPSLLR